MATYLGYGSTKLDLMFRCCLEIFILRNKPEMVDVAALHMWNQKYGPQVIFDCKARKSSQIEVVIECGLNI